MFGSPDLVMTRLQGRSRHHRVPRGLPPRLTERWPRATGLSSYLSGCFGVLQLGDPVFRTAPSRRFCELCRVRPLPDFLFHFRTPRFSHGPFGEVASPGSEIRAGLQ